jgi:hypothetical protein
MRHFSSRRIRSRSITLAAALVAVGAGVVACSADATSATAGDTVASAEARDSAVPTTGSLRPIGVPSGHNPTARTTPIDYRGGAVMSGTVDVYLVYYGTWSAADKAILSDLVTSLDGSPYLNINSGYGDSAGGRVSARVRLAGTVDDAYSRGKTLTGDDVQTIANAPITRGTFPRSGNAVYFVLGAADVTQDGFCTSHCGWHTHASLSSVDVKYSFVGNAATKCPSSCGAVTPSPNGSAGPDAMASVLAHELSETISDPDLNAWYDKDGEENADKCAWTFGSTYKTSNGSDANVRLGARDFRLQQNWANEMAGYCALKLHTVGDFSGEGMPDLLWHNTTSGELGTWIGTGPEGLNVDHDTRLSWNVKGTEWQAKTTGDFNNDGVPDILWHNTTTGEVAAWIMGGPGNTQVQRGVTLSWNVKGNDWLLKGAADFNNDGQIDVLWHNPGTGQISVWFMKSDGATVDHDAMLTWNVKGNDWRLKGTADFNRDGFPDLLWHNAGTGQVGIWVMGGADGTVVDHDTMLSWNVKGTDWHLKGAFDFNRDGHVDLVWHNPGTGQVGTWSMTGADGTTVDHNGFFTWNVPGLTWHIVGVDE